MNVMHSWEIDPCSISSARQVGELMDAKRKEERIQQEEIDRKRRIEKATVELNEETKKQNEILKTQLAEMKTANDLLVKQAADSAKLARISLLVAIVSAIGTVLSLVL
jgi:Flp pilus assembly protein TadB